MSKAYLITFSVTLVISAIMAVLPVHVALGGFELESLTQMAVLGIVIFVLALLLSAIGALLSLQVGSSSSPVSGTVFVAMLLLALVFSLTFSRPEITPLVYLLVTLCVAVCAANDSSQDYRTLVLQGYPVSFGYVPQLLGLLAGAAVVPATLWVAHESFYLGGAELPAPQASFFALVLLSLVENSVKPVGTILAGVALGLVAVLVEVLAKRRGRALSSVAFCVGLYLPPSIGIGIVLGAGCRWLGRRAAVATSAAEEGPSSSRPTGVNASAPHARGILVAAAFISMDAAVSLGFGISSIFGYWIPGGSDTAASQTLSAACFLALLFYLWLSFWWPTRDRLPE